MYKKRLKWFLILTLSVAFLYEAYELSLKFIINDYQILRIEERLKHNYAQNHEQLEELAIYASQFENFDFAINAKDKLEISISNSFETSDDEVWFLIKGDSIQVDGISLNKKDLEQVILKSVLFDTLQIHKWRIEYSGTKKSSIASMILNSKRITEQDFQEMIERLSAVNSIGISKNEQRILIRYKGFKFDNFNYIYPSKANNEQLNYNYLSENFYWEHYQFESYCGFTNWAWL